MSESRLLDLLLRWENAQERGEQLSPEGLCPNDSALAAELRRRIGWLRTLGSHGGVSPKATLEGPTPGERGHRPDRLAPPWREPTGLDLRDYPLLDQLGHGGMGEVYRSRDPSLGRDLALKVLRPELQGNSDWERRFEQEARITGSLQHAGIVPVHNLGRLRDGRLFFTMKVVRGQTLAKVLAERGAAARQAEHLTVFVQVCQAVAYAHSQGVIHRDLKPENVMVGRFGEVQVIDWGLAKLLGRGQEPQKETSANLSEAPAPGTEAPMAETCGALGTRAYMAPEQANGEWEQADERLDVFGLGGILCAILTGQPPYVGASPGEVFRKAQRGDLAEAFARLDGCGADAPLVGLAKECLSAEKDGRPREAGVVASRMTAYLAAVQQRLHAAEVGRVAAHLSGGRGVGSGHAPPAPGSSAGGRTIGDGGPGYGDRHLPVG